MADIRDDDRTLLPQASNPPAGHALPGGPDAIVAATSVPLPRVEETRAALDPDGTRRQIVETRARMSDTIDQIEERLLQQKEKIRAQMDVRGQIRERLSPVRDVVDRQPLAVLGGVVALGLALGYLTGGRGGDAQLVADGEDGGESGQGRWRRQARRWETRSRELMRENSRLELELRSLRESLEDGYDQEEESGGWGSLLAGAVGGMLRRTRTRTERVVELVDDDLPGDYHPSASYDQFAGAQRGREPGDPLQG